MTLMRINPLMIGGCPRSGTTALVQVFNSNASVHISSEENLINTKKVFDKLLGTYERRAKVFEDIGVRELSQRESFSAENILASNFTAKATWPMIYELYKWHHSQRYDDMALELWGDKLPNYFKDLTSVLAIPHVRYLHVTRNPFDVVNSMLRRTAMAKKGRDWWTAVTEIDDMIKMWANAYNAINEAEQHANVFHFHYEELVFNFEATVSKINYFLDVDLNYQNVMIDEPEKHYERSFLNEEIINRILSCPEVADYIDKYSGRLDEASVSKSLENIAQLQKNIPCNKEDLVRVFIAATPAEWLPARVLEFSIREKTDLEVEIQYLYQSEIEVPVPHDIENKPRTPFSFQRFLIPELCNHSGRAIYLDADMQVFHDIAGLWNQSFSGCDLQTVQEYGEGRKGQFSVMLLDCERLNWDIKHIVDALDAGEIDYSGLMYEMKVASNIGREIDSSWNSLETFEPEVTSLLHYTDMNTQPWISLANPLSYLWISCLRRALSSGYITREDIEREVYSGHVRPSLIAQLATEIDNTIALPRNIKILDRRYSAPYKQLNSGRARSWSSIHRVLYRAIRRGYYSSPLPRLFLKK